MIFQMLRTFVHEVCEKMVDLEVCRTPIDIKYYTQNNIWCLIILHIIELIHRQSVVRGQEECDDEGEGLAEGQAGSRHGNSVAEMFCKIHLRLGQNLIYDRFRQPAL